MKTFDALQQLKKDLELDTQQRAEEFGKFCRVLVHDLATPVATISMETQSLKVFIEKLRSRLNPDQYEASDFVESMDAIAENISKASNVLEKLTDKIREVQELTNPDRE